ncbi:endonuclease NucS domain-containing protein [Sinomonas gamaensis]|uniref:endonuclease NucS domain-containing protein n=1 Tax=Sinomonas gamaensis TaxID=2565624 RepID=UPI0011082FDA|nr:endonuclease NucS domain-containing protein [Sinomonas gamaensis]
MPVEVGLWRIDERAERVHQRQMPFESKLEQLILDDPEILEAKLLLLGSQVPTRYGKFIDILGLDAEGSLHVLELKRDRTPRDVVGQILDYASWIQELGNADVRDIFDANHPGASLDERFAERFDGAPVPDELNSAHRLTIVASDPDPATERIVTYLNKFHGVPINVMKFQYFQDNGHEYLARTWVVDEALPTASTVTGRSASTRAVWNGRDWYAAFGHVPAGGRNWDDARKYGFISAGGGEWYSRSLKSLPEGARVFVHVPKHGYVGVGIAAGPARPTDEAVLTHDGVAQPFRSLELAGRYFDPSSEERDDTAEYVVPVVWIKTVSLEDAFWRQGLFANQNSACKLRNQFTIDEVSKAFGLGDEETSLPS